METLFGVSQAAMMRKKSSSALPRWTPWFALPLTAAILLLSAAGCGPQYKTYYSLTPPETASGLQCLNTCQSIMQQCEANQLMEYNNCEQNALREYQICEAGRVMAPDPKLGWSAPRCVRNCSCSRDWCSSPDPEVCQSRYYECYSNCGGIVNTSTVCVANCENTPPPPTPVR